MTAEECLDRILKAYSEGDHYNEIREAKAEFFQRAGKVAEGSDLFELQMKAFIDWYLFDRPLLKYDLAPVKMYVVQNAKTFSPQEHEVFEGFTKSIHSLFEFIKEKKGDVYVQDMVSGEKYVVEDSIITKGFEKGDIFETRLIPFQGRYVFGGSFVFHPRDSKSFIKKQIKQIKYLDEKQRLKLMHTLSSMKLKTKQYSHIDVKYIYTENPLF